MTISRAILALLSFLLCFTILAQADQGLDESYDQPVVSDVYSIESSSDCDINDIGLLPGPVPSGYIPRLKACAGLDNFYRQLVISPPRRPPVV